MGQSAVSQRILSIMSLLLPLRRICSGGALTNKEIEVTDLAAAAAARSAAAQARAQAAAAAQQAMYAAWAGGGGGGGGSGGGGAAHGGSDDDTKPDTKRDHKGNGFGGGGGGGSVAGDAAAAKAAAIDAALAVDAKPVLTMSNEADEVCGLCGEVPEEAVRSGCQHWFCKECLLGALPERASAAKCPTCKRYMDTSSLRKGDAAPSGGADEGEEEGEADDDGAGAAASKPAPKPKAAPKPAAKPKPPAKPKAGAKKPAAKKRKPPSDDESSGEDTPSDSDGGGDDDEEMADASDSEPAAARAARPRRAAAAKGGRGASRAPAADDDDAAADDADGAGGDASDGDTSDGDESNGGAAPPPAAKGKGKAAAKPKPAAKPKKPKPLAPGVALQVESKLSALLKALKAMRDEDSTAKALIFTQFNTTLEWLGARLVEEGFTFRHISGSMPLKQRTKAILAFQKDPPTTVFLLSMRSGAVGINLTSATHVFLMEPVLNPALEAQAIGRSWRMGQKRPVSVYHLFVADSVEERILQLAEQRRAAVGKADAKSGALGELLASKGKGKKVLAGDIAGAIRDDKQEARTPVHHI